MNFTQMHERLRLELLRRIQRGTLSVSLLARQTGFGQSHLSNFLHCKRQLSLAALDRVLAAQHLAAADLIPAAPGADWAQNENLRSVPLVSHATAMHEPLVRPSAVQKLLQAPAGLLESARPRASSSRRTWLRFVAVRVSPADAAAMEPLIQPDALVLLDRHYNSLAPYRPTRPNLYAVRHESQLKLRYADFQASRLLLRPCNMAVPVELVEIDPGESPGDLITGRVVLVMNEL
ncbi:MAG TPA: hypothetical protein VG225_01695 [Terracidiphilus sp.]|jgi:hypothetical protein|nr:hypothetical protein [Terracidiphilus sp.]